MPSRTLIPDRFKYLETAPCPAWLRNALYEVRLGVFEVPGPESNPRIIEYRVWAKISIAGDDSVVPWCAIGTNAMLEKAGMRGTRSAMARSFTRNNNFEKLVSAAFGCVVVLSSSRGPTSGHAGFYVGETETHVYLAGPNQNDGWTIAPFPKTKVLGYYWPKMAPRLPAPWNKPYKLAAAAPVASATRDA